MASSRLAIGVLSNRDWRFRDQRLAFSRPAIGVLYNGERHTLFLIVDDEQLAHVLRGAEDGTRMPFSILGGQPPSYPYVTVSVFRRSISTLSVGFLYLMWDAYRHSPR